MKFTLLVVALLALTGCKTVLQDDRNTATYTKYRLLKDAYDNCLGPLRFETTTFEQRVACTQAVYGGGT